MEDKEQPRTRNRQACHHMVKQQEISLIACIAQNGAIGFHNRLLYPIKQDMQRFKMLTTGHTVIMGRKTYLSLPNGPLPNRRNIIVSKTMMKEQSEGTVKEQSAGMASANEAESKNRELSHASAPQYEVCRSLEEALSRCRDQDEKEVFIIGGAMLYRSALSLATRLYLTIVEDTTQQADTFFPLTANEVECLNQAGWKKVKEETHDEGGLTFRFVDLEKCLKNVKIKTTNHAEQIIRF